MGTEGTKKILELLQKTDGVLVTDFDGTLTRSGSSLHQAAKVLGENSSLARERDRLYRIYGQKAAAKNGGGEEASLLWWKEQMELYVRENLPQEIFQRAAEALRPREECTELLASCMREKIPVFVVSAGLGNVISFWLLRQGIFGEGLFLTANQIDYREERACGYRKPVTPWNKAERFFEEAGRYKEHYLVFLGDRKEDLGWRRENSGSFLIKENRVYGEQYV